MNLLPLLFAVSFSWAQETEEPGEEPTEEAPVETPADAPTDEAEAEEEPARPPPWADPTATPPTPAPRPRPAQGPGPGARGARGGKHHACRQWEISVWDPKASGCAAYPSAADGDWCALPEGVTPVQPVADSRKWWIKRCAETE